MSAFAYFGPAGTFTEMALDQLIRDADLMSALGVTGEPDIVPAANPAATIAMVRAGEADFGCVPIESSLEGSVPATMDALVAADDAHRVQVLAETILDITFTIGATRALRPDEVRTVAAYPVAEGQVRASIGKLYPEATFVTAASNAAAAQDVAAGRADAAVTTAPAARLAGLTVLADGIADVTDATTRFLLIGRPRSLRDRTGADRTSVILDLSNEPGSLMSAMNEFASRGVDLTRIESRPRRDQQRGSHAAVVYRFFLDAVGHLDDDAVAEALAALYRSCDGVTFLGSWPADRSTGAPPPDHTDSRDWLARMRDPSCPQRGA